VTSRRPRDSAVTLLGLGLRPSAWARARFELRRDSAPDAEERDLVEDALDCTGFFSTTSPRGACDGSAVETSTGIRDSFGFSCILRYRPLPSRSA
jgi:hypothetical protein